MILHDAEVEEGVVRTIRCPLCPYQATQDGDELTTLVPGDPDVGHVWSW